MASISSSHRKDSRLVTSSCAWITLFALSPVAHAAEDRSAALEEIIVTAQKREESLQIVPIAVTALSAEDLEMRSAANLRDVARFTPSLVVSNTGGSPNQAAIFIRGIGEPEQFTTADPAVGVYVDGVYHGRAQGSLMDLLDLERVEVLRGPQGTLFGRNAIGGAVNLVSAPPSQKSSAKLTLTHGNHERWEMGARVNGALVEDALFARAAVKHTERGCLARTVNLGDCIGGIDTEAARLSLRWVPSEAVTIDLTADYIDDDSNVMPSSLLYADPSEPIPAYYNDLVASGVLGPDAVPFTGNEPAAVSDDPYVAASQVTTAAPYDVFGSSLKLVWSIGANLDLIAISAYRELDQSYAFDFDKTEADMQSIFTSTQASQFSQEMRLEGAALDRHLRWIAGLYYFEEQSEYAERGRGALNARYDNVKSPKQTTESVAVFGHLGYDLTERLALTGGLRYSADKKEVHFRYADLTTDAPGVFSLMDQKREESWSELSPRIGLDYQHDDDLFLYASVARGYRNGGFNGRAQTLAQTVPYDPETLTSYEIGMKSQWLNDRLRLNAAGYFSDYKDRQVLFFLIDPETSASTQVVENAAAAEVMGFELELTALVTKGLKLEANVGYTDAAITDSDPGSSITKASAYPYAPDWTVAAATEYRLPAFSGSSLPGELRLRIDYTYRSKTNFFPRVPGVDDAYTFQNALGLWNARLAYTSDDGKWDVAFWGRNLGDEIYCLQCASAPGLGLAVGDFSEGREYGLTVSYAFP